MDSFEDGRHDGEHEHDHSAKAVQGSRPQIRPFHGIEHCVATVSLLVNSWQVLRHAWWLARDSTCLQALEGQFFQANCLSKFSRGISKGRWTLLFFRSWYWHHSTHKERQLSVSLHRQTTSQLVGRQRRDTTIDYRWVFSEVYCNSFEFKSFCLFMQAEAFTDIIQDWRKVGGSSWRAVGIITITAWTIISEPDACAFSCPPECWGTDASSIPGTAQAFPSSTSFKICDGNSVQPACKVQGKDEVGPCQATWDKWGFVNTCSVPINAIRQYRDGS